MVRVDNSVGLYLRDKAVSGCGGGCKWIDAVHASQEGGISWDIESHGVAGRVQSHISEYGLIAGKGPRYRRSGNYGHVLSWYRWDGYGPRILGRTRCDVISVNISVYDLV